MKKIIYKIEFLKILYYKGLCHSILTYLKAPLIREFLNTHDISVLSNALGLLILS